MDWGDSITYFGATTFKGKETPFGMKDTDRSGHLAVIGREEEGRAKLLANLALRDIERGVGTLILDAHGELIKLVLERVGSDLHERIIFLDPSDGEYPFSWNPLDEFRALPDTEARGTLARALASCYRVPPSTVVNALADRLIEDPGTSLVSAHELVTGETQRKRPAPDKKQIEPNTLDAVFKKYASDTERIKENGRYIAKDTLLRNLMGQRASKFSLDVFERGGVVVVDLSRIRMFPTRIAPLARIFVHAARARARASGIPVAVYLHDSLRNFAEEDIEFLFSDRALALSVSDTAVSEEDRPVREKAISRSVSIATFSPSSTDLTFAEKLFYPYVGGEELTRLEKDEFVLALSIDGVRARPFFAHVLPLPPHANASYQDIIAVSREKYALPRSKVDQLFKYVDEDEGDDDPGSFSDTFRSIFAKRAGAAGAPPAAAPKMPAAPAGPAPARPFPPGASTPRPAPVAPVKAPLSPPQNPKPSEVPEDVLKRMLYVEPVSA